MDKERIIKLFSRENVTIKAHCSAYIAISKMSRIPKEKLAITRRDFSHRYYDDLIIYPSFYTSDLFIDSIMVHNPTAHEVSVSKIQALAELLLIDYPNVKV